MGGENRTSAKNWTSFLGGGGLVAFFSFWAGFSFSFIKKRKSRNPSTLRIMCDAQPSELSRDRTEQQLKNRNTLHPAEFAKNKKKNK